MSHSRIHLVPRQVAVAFVVLVSSLPLARAQDAPPPVAPAAPESPPPTTEAAAPVARGVGIELGLLAAPTITTSPTAAANATFLRFAPHLGFGYLGEDWFLDADLTLGVLGVAAALYGLADGPPMPGLEQLFAPSATNGAAVGLVHGNLVGMRVGGEAVRLGPVQLGGALTFDLGVAQLSPRLSNGFLDLDRHLMGSAYVGAGVGPWAMWHITPSLMTMASVVPDINFSNNSATFFNAWGTRVIGDVVYTIVPAFLSLRAQAGYELRSFFDPNVAGTFHVVHGRGSVIFHF